MFVKIEDVILNTDHIVSVIVNQKIVKFGKSICGKHEYEPNGVCVNLVSDCHYIFKTYSLDEFEKLLNIGDGV